jgi:cytoskeletal protein CcmA (bactofilin family)
MPSNSTTLENTTVIGAGTFIKGEMVFDADALILGTFEGKITTRGEIQIGQQATCKATIQGATVIVDGLVEGDIVGIERVQLNATARVIGNIVAAAMIMAPGAILNGQVRIGDLEHASAPAAPALQENESSRLSGQAYRNGMERSAR